MDRKMVRAELLGQHSHRTVCGREVHVWQRDGKYLARGRHCNRVFGKTLGADEVKAAAGLRRLLDEIEDGTFERPSEARRKPLKVGTIPRLSFRGLSNNYLAETRQLRGKRTANDYRNRLTPIIEFAEQPDQRKRYPLASDMDRQFAVDCRAYLHHRKVTRNGQAAAAEQPMSPGQIYNVLDCTRSLLNWAKRPDVNQLPSWFVNPFDKAIVGQRASKDPLRRAVLPLNERIKLVQHMDLWHLCHFAIPIVLPLRPEDYTGLLISEVDFTAGRLRFGSRFDGRDFNKGRQSFQVPFPAEIEQLLHVCAGGRQEGPLLQGRSCFEKRRKPKYPVASAEEFKVCFDRALAAARPGEIQAEQDFKRVVRKLLQAMGGASPDAMAKEFKSLLTKSHLPESARLYDLRGSVNTELNSAGVSHLLQTYITGHTTRDILHEYVSLEPEAEMERYFAAIRPLLGAIEQRARELGLALSSNEPNCRRDEAETTVLFGPRQPVILEESSSSPSPMHQPDARCTDGAQRVHADRHGDPASPSAGQERALCVSV